MIEDSAELLAEARAGSGTQAVSRATTILRLLARRGIEGLRLTQLTKLTGLPHPTIRRILICLMTERLVLQDPTTRRYHLGPLNFELGLATLRHARFDHAHEAMLPRLAQQSGDTVYLMARGGADIVCLALAEGHYPIRSHTFSVGSRRPLGFGAAGLALLAELDDDEVERVIQINSREIENHGRITPDYLRKAVANTRARGYAVTSNIYTQGVSSVARVIPRGDERPIYAVNISPVGLDRFTPARIEKLQLMIRAELDRLAANPAPPAWPSSD
jgi:DNA-binding IclR family transcriptional regulator